MIFLIFQRTPERSDRISCATTSHDRGVTCGWWCDKATLSLSLLLAQVSKFFTFAILRFPQRWCCDAEMDNSGKEKEAMALMAEAEKKMKSSQSFFGSLFGWVCHFGYYLANVDKLKANKAERLKHIDWHHIGGTTSNLSTLLQHPFVLS